MNPAHRHPLPLRRRPGLGPGPRWIHLLLLAALAVPMPIGRSSAAPEPTKAAAGEVPALLGRMLDRAKQDAADRPVFLQRHAHTQTRIREERSSKGDLRSRTEERTHHSPAPPSGGDSIPGPGKRAYHERDFSLTRELLERFEFTLAGREQLAGRTACRLDFRPRSDSLPVKKMADRFVNRIAGTVWISETDGALIRARLHLLDKVSFVGGIAGACHSLRCALERDVTPDGFWYTRSSHWTVDYREFLVRKTVDLTETTELQVGAASP